MKIIDRLNFKIMAVVLSGMAAMDARADSTLSLSNFSGSTGAGSSDISAFATKVSTTAQNLITATLIVIAGIGVFTFAGSMYGIYKAQKDNRDSPKTAVVGLIIGACMTIVPLLIGLMRNTASV